MSSFDNMIITTPVHLPKFGEYKEAGKPTVYAKLSISVAKNLFGNQAQDFFSFQVYIDGYGTANTELMTVVNGVLHDASRNASDRLFNGKKIVTTPMVHLPAPNAVTLIEHWDLVARVFNDAIAIHTQEIISTRVTYPLISDVVEPHRIETLKAERDCYLERDGGDYIYIPSDYVNPVTAFIKKHAKQSEQKYCYSY